MDTVEGDAAALGRAAWLQMARYRHQVFVQALGWDLPSRDGLELDQFDRPDTRYVLARDAAGHCTGVARLLPTTQPYLLGDVFPQLMGQAPLPCSPQVWELSRFAAMDVQGGDTRSAYASPGAVQLLGAALAAAARQGAQQLISVSPLGVERLLRQAGFRSWRAAAPQRVGRHWLFACWIEIGTATYQL